MWAAFCGVSSLWFQRVVKGERYGVVVLLKNDRNVCGYSKLGKTERSGDCCKVAQG